MKYLLLLGLCFLSFSSFGQFYIHWSEKQVRENVRNPINTDYTDTGLKYLSWKDEDMKAINSVIFSNGYVVALMLTPSSTTVVNSTIEAYNKIAVVISKEEWRLYKNGRIYRIQLKYNDAYYFLHTDITDE